MITHTDYLDLQVNGYAGADFNRADLSGESLRKACEQLKNDGVSGVLATVITDDLDAMIAKLQRLVKLREQDSLAREIIWGFHIEGPFLSPELGYIGAHPVHAAISANLDAMKRLLDAACGLARIVTLAPECDTNCDVTRYLADQGIVVSAGHTNASLDELSAAIDAGLSMVTHLGNGCPMTLHRHDNIIQRVLSLSDRLWISFIADGAHIPFFALGNYLARIGLDRAVIVTDAINAAGLGPGRYSLGNQEIDIGEDLVPRSKDQSHFVGSATIMSRMAANLRKELGLTKQQVHQLCFDNPRRVLNVS